MFSLQFFGQFPEDEREKGEPFRAFSRLFDLDASHRCKSKDKKQAFRAPVAPEAPK